MKRIIWWISMMIKSRETHNVIMSRVPKTEISLKNLTLPVCFTRNRRSLVLRIIIIIRLFLHLIKWILNLEKRLEKDVYWSVVSPRPTEFKRSLSHTHTQWERGSFIKTCKLFSLVRPGNICLGLLIEWTELIISSKSDNRLHIVKTDKQTQADIWSHKDWAIYWGEEFSRISVTVSNLLRFNQEQGPYPTPDANWCKAPWHWSNCL